MDREVDKNGKFKEEIKERWEDAAEGYYEGVKKELEGPKKDAWKNYISDLLPEGKKMKVLDIGTGPGFFPVVLGMEGHSVTGIDVTDNMLKYARKNAEEYGVDAEFLKMDCAHPEFDDETFDLIICRNLTWILLEPEETFKEWKRILKTGGRLLIFDANWNRYLFCGELRKKRDENLKRVREKYGAASHDHLDQDEMEAEGRALPMGRNDRPSWDLETFIKMGFKKVFADTDISDTIPFSEKELMEYEGVSPQFMVGAIK